MIQSVANEGSDYGTIDSGRGSSGHRDAQARDEAADQRDQAGDERDEAAAQRDQAGDERDEAAAQRDETADRRDQAGDERDRAGNRRDRAGDRRDQAAHQRDLAAERRDLVAQQFATQVGAGTTTEALDRSALARQEAASDRRGASLDRVAGANERMEADIDRDTALADRGAGANERTDAEHDRDTALTDRGAGADERTDAGHDRDTALTDRGDSARERASASLDGLTGLYLRGPGRLELEREVARAKRTDQPLVLAFVDVDQLKAINDSRGHAAGDRTLVEVATAIRANLRAYDLIVRYGGDEFVCAILGLTMADVAKRFSLINEALAAAPEQASLSVGLAQLQSEDSPEDLVARADAALYRQRRHGDASGG